jgi:GR25 family glycosyltransferase involved in LPS biosynthesis
MLNSFDNIQHVVYINLEKRTDRKEWVEHELQVKLEFPQEKVLRFNAISLSNGAMGCSMSHLKCLENARDQGWEHIFIVEDDIQFLDPALFKTQLNGFLKQHNTWDMLLIAGNNLLPYSPIDDTCVQVYNCLTTTGYIIRKHYYNTLIQNIRQGLELFIKNPQDKNKYAVDVYWLLLQQKDKWYLLIPLSVVQRENYSNIEQKTTNFTQFMLNLNKTIRF